MILKNDGPVPGGAVLRASAPVVSLDGEEPLEDLRALANEVERLTLEGVEAYQLNMARIRSHYETLIETADLTDPDTASAVRLFEEAIRLIDKVRARLNKRKGVLHYGRR